MVEEIWKPIMGYEGVYEISDHGNVRRVSSGRILKHKINSDGYKVLTLSKNNIQKEIRVGRYVALHFVNGFREDYVANHKDGDKQNDHYSNLEWTSVSGNTLHAYENRLAKPRWKGVKGAEHPLSKPVVAEKDGFGYYSVGVSDLCSFLKIDKGSAFNVLAGKRVTAKGWKFHYTEEQ